MSRTTAAAVLLAAGVLTLAGCGSGSSTDTKPSAATTKSTRSALTTTQKRRACVDAWAKAINEHASDYDPESGDGPDVDEPAECANVPGESHLQMYMDGLVQRNEAARKPLDDCLKDPSCTSVPIP